MFDDLHVSGFGGRQCDLPPSRIHVRPSKAAGLALTAGGAIAQICMWLMLHFI